ncbi:type II toxin-antitoxin system HicB family antitoxin [Lysinibacillus telephonicus]|uniref:Type II toxin-antitoxin system HicB family antitoxin n=1 Tax=Lysinibacillus telephonicus TaxID=1714840 RepID=A0A3S0HJI0_9BACI|nr:type II toxin-antitoxin system HicB family antitoxin [Lysinibacillus telephonicus]RTQ90823.1 type II toxin-antitoxin system HicB family antitoxin [Lysinibacillus telephonicus]
MTFENVVYPAFIKREEEGFGIHFPTLLPKYGWEFSLCSGHTKKEAVQNAEKALAYLLAGALYDNEDLPSQAPIPSELVTEEMELISIKTSYSDYAKEIEEHLPRRHWHIYFNRDEKSNFQAVAYKNKQGFWDVKIDGDLPVKIEQKKLLQLCPTYPVVCTVRRRAEAEELFDSFVLRLEEL